MSTRRSFADSGRMKTYTPEDIIGLEFALYRSSAGPLFGHFAGKAIDGLGRLRYIPSCRLRGL